MNRRKGLLVVLLVALVGAGVWWWTRNSGEPEKASAAAHDDAARSRPKAFGKPGKDVWSEPKAGLRGVVRDPDGKPIRGATVCAATQADDVSTAIQREPVCTLTEPGGHYTLEELYPIAYRVSASAPGHQPAIYQDPEAPRSRRHRVHLRAGEVRDGVDLVLAAGGVVVRGVVKDLSGGPVAGAWVRVQGGGWFGDRPFAGTVSDDDGAFEAWAAAGNVTVIAAADGYTQTQERGIAPGQTFELFLTPASTLVGKVVFAETGEPVAGAKVSARMNDIFTRTVGHTHSEEDGTFRLEGIEPGTYKLAATTPELYGLSAEAVHLGLAETSEPVVVQVHPAFSVEGKVVLAGTEGDPCPTGSLELSDAERDLRGRAELAPDGSALVEALQPGTYRVTVSCDGYVSRDDYPEIVIADASVEGQLWEVDPGLAIRGEVVLAGGTPVSGVSVVARPKATPDDPRAQKTNAFGLETDATGAFELTGLLPGPYSLTTFSNEVPRPTPEPEIELVQGRDAEGVRIELPATGTVRGTVRDERGETLAGVSVTARGGFRAQTSTTSTDDGSYELVHVVAGSVRVSASGKNWGDRMRAPGQTDDDVAGERVEVAAGGTVDVDLVVESQGGRIRGQVVDADGGPVSDAFVDFERESDSAAASAGSARRSMGWGSWFRDPILTDVDGRFELDEVVDGTYTLRAYRQGGGEGVLEGVAVGADVTVELDTPGSLAGTVAVAGGTAPERFRLQVIDDESGVRLRDEFFRTGGQWRITDVPEGSYEIVVESPAGTAKTEVELAAGEDKSGIEIALAGTVKLTGTLVDLETGAPVPGMKVTISARTGTVSFGDATTKEKKEISDGQGRFEIGNAPVGQGRLVVTSSGFGKGDYPWTFVPIAIPEGKATHELGPIELVKERVGNGEERGSLGLEIKQSAPGEEDEDRRLVVAFVRPRGPADKAGINTGDEVVEVDGHDVRGAAAYRWGDLTAAPPGHELDLTFADGRTVRLKLGPPE